MRMPVITIPKYKWGKNILDFNLNPEKTYSIDNSAEDVWNDYLNENLESIQKSAWKDSKNYKKFLKESAYLEDPFGNIENDAFNKWAQSRKGQRLVNRTIKNTRKSFYDVYGNKIQDALDGMKWVDQYYKSKEYKDLSDVVDWTGYHPFRLPLKPAIRFYKSDDNSTVKPTDWGTEDAISMGLKDGNGMYKNDLTTNNQYFLGAHEYAHHMDNVFGGGIYHIYPLQYNEIFDTRSMPLYADDYEFKQHAYDTHDSNNEENYADYIANKAKMAKYGIYDALDPNSKISMKHIKKFRKKYGDSDRLFQMYKDEDIYRMYNTIASNPTLNIPNLV